MATKRNERRKSAYLSWFVENNYVVPFVIKKQHSNGDYKLDELEKLGLQKPQNRDKSPCTILYGPNRAVIPEDFDEEKESESAYTDELWDLFVVGKFKAECVLVRLRDNEVFLYPSHAANEGYSEKYVEVDPIDAVSTNFCSNFRV
jgi:hypothetical protein